MKKSNKRLPKTDLEECRDKILHLLDEYGCELLAADEYCHVLIRDKDTDEYEGFKR